VDLEEGPVGRIAHLPRRWPWLEHLLVLDEPGDVGEGDLAESYAGAPGGAPLSSDRVNIVA
jgi:hypothetical protein